MTAQLANARWGCGFDRQHGWMKVYEDQGRYICDHKDTAAGIHNVETFHTLEDISGFFGYCNRAVTLYNALGIPVRRSA